MTLALQQSRGRPRSRLYQIAHRIAGRMEPRVASRFLAAVERFQRRIVEGDLRSALAAGNFGALTAVVRPAELALLIQASGLEDLLRRASQEVAMADADVLSGVTGVAFEFRATDPATVLFARRQSSDLVVQISAGVREALRLILATAAQYGLTISQQAVAIRQLVGLPPNWANAPMHLAQEIRDGSVNYGRRLSGVDKQKIRSRIKRGTVTEEFVEEMQGTYAKRLIQRRALNIARTETLRAANFGQRESWRQAIQGGVLPDTARRMWVVTPDDRLRDTHAAVPGMNPEGVPVEGGVYETPLGTSEGPPLEVNCRCSEGLVFPGVEGVL